MQGLQEPRAPGVRVPSTQGQDGAKRPLLHVSPAGDGCTQCSEGRTRSLNENAHKTHVRCPGQRVVRAHKHTGSKKNVDHLINICMRYFIFQFMHLIATQMKAINLICTQITFLLFSLYKSKEKLPRQPVQRRIGKRAALLPLRVGGGEQAGAFPRNY